MLFRIFPQYPTWGGIKGGSIEVSGLGNQLNQVFHLIRFFLSFFLFTLDKRWQHVYVTFVEYLKLNMQHFLSAIESTLTSAKLNKGSFLILRPKETLSLNHNKVMLLPWRENKNKKKKKINEQTKLIGLKLNLEIRKY